MDWKDLVERVAWTFAQAFIGVFLASSHAGSKAAAAAGIAAGVSAVKNYAKQITAAKQGQDDAVATNADSAGDGSPPTE